MIKHEKIAARLTKDEAECEGKVAAYRLSHPLMYRPYEDDVGEQSTYFVRVWVGFENGGTEVYPVFKTPPDSPFTKYEADGYPIRGTSMSARDALDALGYELIEEEK